MTRDKIKGLALSVGFQLKPQAGGGLDFHSYVYDFARLVQIDTLQALGEKATALAHQARQDGDQARIDGSCTAIALIAVEQVTLEKTLELERAVREITL